MKTEKLNHQIIRPLFFICFLIALIACKQKSNEKSSAPDKEVNAKTHYDLISPDGNYGAIIVGTNINKHYKIIEIKTSNEILTTKGQFDDSDVKDGKFSPDSKKFAALYHYSHNGGYAWIGIFDLQTRARDEKIIKNTTKDEYLTTIDNSIFK